MDYFVSSTERLQRPSGRRSCNEIKVYGSHSGVGKYEDGVYIIEKDDVNVQPVYCDMTSDLGAWTLLLTSTSNDLWISEQVLSRNVNNPSLASDYSIIGLADKIKTINNNGSITYKLDDKSRYSDLSGVYKVPKMSKVTVIPSTRRVMNKLTLPANRRNSGLMWYWINEDDCNKDRLAVHGGLGEWSEWNPCSVQCGKGIQMRIRSCNSPEPVCGGKQCEDTSNRKEKQECDGHCPESPIQSFDGQLCIQPESGGCSPEDNGRLVWKSKSCDKIESAFIMDAENGEITHKCSKKRVCPLDGSTDWGTEIVVSSQCPKGSGQNKFIRTHEKALHYHDKCVNPQWNEVKDGHKLTLWADCDKDENVMDFFKIGDGPVKFKEWKNLRGRGKDIQKLTRDPRYPNRPSSSGFIDNLDNPQYLFDKYGVEMTTFLRAFETGNYIFKASCDDICQLFIGEANTQSAKKKILDGNTWTDRYEWNKHISSPIRLDAGKIYPLKAIMYSENGLNHLAVGMVLPNGKEMQPITKVYLSQRPGQN